MKRFMNKKVAAVAAAVGLTLGLGGAAFAYFTSAGSGTGQGAVGTSQNVTVDQDSITYNGPSNGSTNGNLQPGDTATVAFGITNPGGDEYVADINMTSWTSSVTGCASTDTYNGHAEAGWFSMGQVTVDQDFGNGNDQTTGDSGTITFNDEGYSQNICENATITFTYTSD